MRVLLLLLLVLCGCAGSQGARPDPRSLLYSGQYVACATRLLEVMHDISGSSSSERKAEAKAMLEDEVLGKGLEQEVRRRAVSLKTRHDTVALMESIALVAQYNSYLQQHREALELDVCRTITPKVLTGEIWLTAENSNYTYCLQDREYVQAIVSNSLSAIEKYDSKRENEALQALAKHVPFADITTTTFAESRRAVTKQVEESKEAVKPDKNAAAAQIAASKPKPRVSLKIIPAKYSSFHWVIEKSMKTWPHIEYVDNPEEKNTAVVMIRIDEFESVTGPHFSREKRLTRDECDDDIAEIMQEEDRYILFYEESTRTWMLRGSFSIYYGKTGATEPFSLHFQDEIVECRYKKIYPDKGDVITMNEYANREMEHFCTNNPTGIGHRDMLKMFAEIFAKALQNIDWE